ncbi:helix-turn-helix domain-containing protein [Streptomyces beigongshangae]|uniref:helix-turn-helix domain-containing protein n=1 Tax=Streptomyces beigongshangae TaxID=2841597 RepID=UPI001C8606AE|nr:XRE family transcriptional regulator [Streptomyces sp. REN17]
MGGPRPRDAGGTASGAARPAQCERLARTLRELRSATGLSLAALAAKTPYSKSSWERYLNGKALPPRQAVEELCRLAGERQDRPLVLWELAEAVWSGRTGEGAGAASGGAVRDPAAVPDVPPAPGPLDLPVRHHRPVRPVRHVTGVLAGCAAVAAGVLVVTWGFSSGDSDAKGGGAPSRSALEASCFGDACTGRNPESTRCSNADHPPSTLAERRFGGGTVVKVRHSARCGTVWARIDRGREGDRVEITAPGAEPQQNEVRDHFDEEGSLSTPMAAVSPRAFPEVESCLVRDGRRDCFLPAPGKRAGGEREDGTRTGAAGRLLGVVRP